MAVTSEGRIGKMTLDNAGYTALAGTLTPVSSALHEREAESTSETVSPATHLYGAQWCAVGDGTKDHKEPALTYLSPQSTLTPTGNKQWGRGV